MTDETSSGRVYPPPVLALYAATAEMQLADDEPLVGADLDQCRRLHEALQAIGWDITPRRTITVSVGGPLGADPRWTINETGGETRQVWDRLVVRDVTRPHRYQPRQPGGGGPCGVIDNSTAICGETAGHPVHGRGDLDQERG